MLFIRSNFNNITKQLLKKPKIFFQGHFYQSKPKVYNLQQTTLFFSTSKFQSYKQVPLDKSQCQTNFMRSSGPGGQSVNTTNSKAQIRIKINQCQAIDEFIRNNLKQKYKNLINKDDELILRCQIHKSQGSNLDECIDRAKKIIYQCSIVPEQRKYQIPAESQQLRQKRLLSKRKKSDTKQRRRQNKDW